MRDKKKKILKNLKPGDLILYTYLYEAIEGEPKTYSDLFLFLQKRGEAEKYGYAPDYECLLLNGELDTPGKTYWCSFQGDDGQIKVLN